MTHPTERARRCPSGTQVAGRIALVAAGLVGVVGCDSGASSDRTEGDRSAEVADPASHPLADAPVSAPDVVDGAGSYVFTCPDDAPFSARFDSDSAYVDLGTEAFALGQVPSASGARYASGERELWTHGAEATLRIGGATHAGCLMARADDPWERAALLGVDFRGLGQEPGWMVDVDLERWILYVGDYATVRIATPVPALTRGQDGVVTFDAATEAHRLIVRIEPVPCSDVMSGQPFSHTVRLEIDGRRLDGCGRFVGARTDFDGGSP